MTLKAISLVLTIVVLAALPASATVSIFLSAEGFSQPVPPGNHVAWNLGAFRSAQDTNTEAVDVVITMTVPSVLSNFTGSGDRWNCTTSSTTTVCGISLAAATRFSTPLRVEFDAPTTADGGRFVIPATLATSLPNTNPDISAKIEVNTYRTFAVTTADDFGAGSFREAIGRANDHCDRTVACLISFAGPMTIEPRSPLPAVTACFLLIDGGLAQGTSQDVERPVEISGAKAGFANGLEIRSGCGVTLRGLTVNGFGANGVVLAAATPPPPLAPVPLTVEDCFIGTDTKALEARPNGMRGISIETPLTIASVSNSTISGNHYSGIAVWASDALDVSGCRIGLGRDLRPLGNGASGVFVNAGVAEIAGQIAYNHDFGVAVGQGASHVSTSPEGLFANGVLDYDWGLDGPTRTDPAGRMPPAPVLIDAAYDPVHNATVLHCVLPAEGRRPAGFEQFFVRLFEVTSHGYVALQPQTNLTPSSGDFPFTVSVRGDLRGQAIVGQTYFQEFLDGLPNDSSELSAPLAVHP